MNEPIEPDVYRLARRLAELVRRVPPLVWPFLILAGWELVPLLVQSPGSWTVMSVLAAASNAGWALLPAAVIVGRPDALRSARGIFLGALAWSTIGPVGSLAWGVATSIDPATVESSGRVVLRVLAFAAAVAGQAAIVVILERRRRTATTWPRPLVALAVIGVAAACLYQGSTALDWYNSQQGVFMYGVQDDLGARIQVVASAFRPMVLLTLGALAWSSLSAVRAGEAPRRFWSAITAGSAILFVAAVFNYSLSPVLSAVGYSPTIVSVVSTLLDIEAWASVAAVGLVLLAFAIGVPNDAKDVGDVVADPIAAPATAPAS